MFYPSPEEFIKLTKKGNLIPVYKEVLGDLETPVSAHLKMAANAKYSFLLESVEGEEKVARFSFLSKNPELVFQVKGRHAKITRFQNGQATQNDFEIAKPFLSYIREIMSAYQFVSVKGLPRFCGGLVGYFGYDVVRFFEELPKKPADDLNLPDTILVLAKNLVIFDRVNHKIKVVSCASVRAGAGQNEKIQAYKAAASEIEAMIQELQKPLVSETSPTPRALSAAAATPLIRSNFSQAQFERIVAKAKKFIQKGDIIQVVLSQRFETKLGVSPFSIYRVLRSLNPSPYMFYLHFNSTHLIGSSPELLVRCENGIVETRPIAGTRRRGKNEKEDSALSKNLLSDPKELAEHTMLVDLGRNDLGRVCKKGSVKLSEFMAIEKYSHVMHIVSNVKGALRKDKDIFDVLEAAFPAGTVSGAPKIRAMEIIDELENVSRGPYAGCVGYFSFSGNLDTCITIRTIVAANGTAYIQAGAGIVADSNPRKEFTETLNKAKAQIMAIEIAQKQNTKR